jgi:hypothetical protein
MMGLKSTAGSFGNLLGPGLVVLFTPFIGPQIVFLIATALVLILTFASGFALRRPESIKVPHHFSSAAVER